MFAKLHLYSQDTPEGGGGLRWRPHPYLRLAVEVLKGPAAFEWSARQREDLEGLWRDPAADGARERLGKDLAAFADKLGWTPDAEMLEDAEQHGDEYLVTLSAVPPELYVLPWEVIQVGASGTFLSDYASAQVRYAVPGLEPREIQTAPPKPGVLFAWSGAGGAVPHEDQAAAIRTAAEAGGVTFHELADVSEASLQAALDAGPPSVLHLLCHGLPGPDGEPPRLKWGASDSPSEITATQLARMLRRHHGAIRLVVLSACGSGDGHTDPLFMTSLAQELHKKGIPSVVASRYPLSVPGSRVMTRVLYDKMLREAWSLERALRATREALFRVDDQGEPHPGDAYGIQLYAYDTERFISDNNVEATRPVLASYPFGTAARPVPASAPPPAELTLGMDADPGLSEDQLVAKLRHLSEDDSLTISIASPDGKGPRSLRVCTTTDGAQRLLGVWRSKVLQVAVGVVVAELILTKGITPAMAATSSATAAEVAKSAKAAKVGRAIKETSQPFGGGGKLLVAPGQAAGSLAQAVAPAGQAAATAGKVALTATTVVGKTLAAQLAVALVLTGTALVGGAAVYRMYTRPTTCGNGTIEPGKQCNDSNTRDRDGEPAGGGGAGRGGTDGAPTGGGGTGGVVAAGGGTGHRGTDGTTTGAGTTGGVTRGGSGTGREGTDGAPTGGGGTGGATMGGGRTGHGGTDGAPTGGGGTGAVVTGGGTGHRGTDGAPTGAAATGGVITNSGGTGRGGTDGATTGSGATGSGGTGGAATGGGRTGHGGTDGAPTGGGGTGAVVTGGGGTGRGGTDGAPTGAAATGGVITSGGGTGRGGTDRAPTGSGGTGGATTGGGRTGGVVAGGGEAGHGGTDGATTGGGGTGGLVTGGGGTGHRGTDGTPTGSGGGGTGRGGTDGAPTATAPTTTAPTNTAPTATAPTATAPTSTAPTATAPTTTAPTATTPAGEAAMAPRGAATRGATTRGVATGGGTTVEPPVLKGRRISGQTNVQPSDETQSLMIFDGVTSVSGTIALCVSITGVVTKERMWKSTGYDDYDQKLRAAIREWRYRPYVLDGAPAPVCDKVEFHYRMEAPE